MLKLLVLPDCEVCKESKKMLDENNIKYGTIDLTTPDGLNIARKFNIKVAGHYLYDDSDNTIMLVSDYIDSLK